MENKMNTTITLEVDTARINEHNKDNFVTFKDNRGKDHKSNPGEPELFLSRIDVGMQVIWDGKPTDASTGDTVKIKSITKESGPDLLQTIGPPNKGVLTAVVKNTHIDGKEKYKIEFEVIYKDKSSKTFPIDPKLEMTNVK